MLFVGRTAAEKLAIIEQEARHLREEYDTLKSAIVDPALVAWLDAYSPPRLSAESSAPRLLTPFELGTVRRLDELRPQLDKLEAAEAFLVVKTIDEMAGRENEGPEDPETLLTAALVCLAKAWQAGHRSVELRVTLRAIAAYLRSLDEEED